MGHEGTTVTHCDRRGFLCAVAGCALLAAGGVPVVARRERALVERVRSALPAAVGTAALARACGATLAAKGPPAGSLEASLAARLGDDLHRLSPAALRGRIAQQYARDFAGGRTLRVRGWLLADTEVWLYAALGDQNSV